MFVAWLVLPQFKGAAFLYERYVREQIRKYRGVRDQPHHTSPTVNKGKHKFMDFITPKKVSVTLLPFPKFQSQKCYFQACSSFL